MGRRFLALNSPLLRSLAGLGFAIILAVCAAVTWLGQQFEEPGVPRFSSIAGELGATSVLAILAHPDDEISVTGLLLRASARDGAVTRSITATRGENGTPLPQISRLEDLGTVREAELLKNGYAIGMTDQDVWDYPDGGLAEADFETYVERLMARMREWQPELVVTFWPESGFSGHPDHRTAGRAATEAVRRLQVEAPDTAPRAIAYILAPRRMMRRFGGETGQRVADNQPDPTHAMPAEGGAKIRAWRIHASQSDYVRHAYGFPAWFVHSLYDTEHYHVVEYPRGVLGENARDG